MARGRTNASTGVANPVRCEFTSLDGEQEGIAYPPVSTALQSLFEPLDAVFDELDLENSLTVSDLQLTD